MRALRAASLAALSVSCLVAARCALPGPAPYSPIRILSYNVKSLFDARDDGAEFPEFSVAGGRWSEASYRLRLANVAKAVLAAGGEGGPAGPDVACLVEIENEGVLADLCEGPLAPARYRHRAIAPAAGGPFSVALLSRLPVLGLAAHSPTGAGSGAGAGRPMLEARLDAGGRTLVLLLCHWKSKSGGERETEDARREAAALARSIVASELAADPAAEILVCGDFNESPDEARRVGGAYDTAFVGVESLGREADAGERPAVPAGDAPAEPGWRAIPRLLVASRAADAAPRGGEPVLFSPWAEAGGYSYSYRGERSRIDGFLLAAGLLDAAGLVYRGFSVLDEPFLLDSSGDPIPWSGSSGTGFSDHLPILLALEARTPGS